MVGLKVIKRYDIETYEYIRLYLENGKVVDEHRYIMANYLNRELLYNEVVHHKDGNKKNNNIENLELLSRRTHASNHGIKSDDEKLIKIECEYCGKIFTINIKDFKYKTSKGQVNFYCSRSCCVKNQWKIKKDIHL